MQSLHNCFQTTPTVSDSPISEFTRNASAQDTQPGIHQNHLEYNTDITIHSFAIAGNLRFPSSPTTSLHSFIDKRQEPLRDELTLRPAHHRDVTSVTVISSTVTQNTTRFAGDHRFPPGRPPNNNDISRPDQTAAINRALSLWANPEPCHRPTNSDCAASGEAIRLLIHAPPATAGPTVLKQMKTFEQMATTSVCDPMSFVDPEHIIRSVDGTETRPGGLRKDHMRPKRGISRLLYGPPAGAGHSNNPPEPQALISRTSVGMCNPKKPAANLSARADPAAVQPLSLTGTPTAPQRSAPRQEETKTPKDRKYLDFVLDDRLAPDNKDRWVHNMIKQLITQVDPLTLRLRVVAYRNISTNVQRPLPRICDASHNSGGADHREGGADARERAQINEFPAAQESSVIVKGRIAEESELLTPKLTSEKAQVPTPIVARAPAAQCRAEHTLPSTPLCRQRSRTTNRKASTPSALTTAGQVKSVDPRGAQQYISSREPHARDSASSKKAEHQPAVPKRTAALGTLVPTDSDAHVRVSEPLTLGGVLTSDPIDRALPGRPPRRRRGGKRGRGTPPSQPTAAVGGGGDDSRGAQTRHSNREFGATECAPTDEVDPGLPQLPPVEDMAAALHATPVSESTVPVNGPAAARLLPPQVPERGTMDSLAQAGALEGTGHGGTACCMSLCQEGGLTLSQRREFLDRKQSKADSAACLGSLGISELRGMRLRQVVVGNGLVGQSPTLTRFPRPGTREMTGSGLNLMYMGPAGVVSERFPVQAERGYRVRRGRRGHRYRHKRKGQDLTGDAERGDMARVERAGSRAGPPSLQDHREMGTVSWAVEARSATEYSATSNCSGIVSVSGEMTSGGMTRESSLRMDRSGLTARWERRAAKTTLLVETPDVPGDGSGKDTNPMVTVMGNCENALKALGGPSSEAEKDVGPSELPSEPNSVETWLMRGGLRRPLEIRLEDWSKMQDLGLGPHPDLAVTFAWRRSLGRASEQQSTIHLVSHAALDIPKDAWPTTWEGLVEHVGNGGYFRTVPHLRGGMDPAEAQRILNSTNFDDEHLPWDVIDQNLAHVRAGGVVSPNEITEPMRLAQALFGCVALQQWDPLATFLGNLPPEVRTGLILSPARLAALSVLAARFRREPEPPPQWLGSSSFAELRFHHLSPSDFVPDPHRANDLRGQIQDGIVHRLLSVAPDIRNHPHYRLQNLRSDLRVELNLKDQQVETCLFSVIAVLPTGPWISDFYSGVKSLGGRSFCTIAPTDLHIETELSNTDQQVIRAIRSALGVDNATFRLILDESLSKAFLCEARSRDDTVRFTSNGGKGGKRTMEHVSPDSPDSRLLVTMDGTSLLLARRVDTRRPIKLGPVTFGITIPQCSQQALRSVLQPREPAAIQLRVQGAMIDCPIILLGPLPKGSIPARTVNSGAKLADLRHHMHEVCRKELNTTDVRLVGRYEKDRSPMFLYLEFGSANAAQFLGSMVDHHQVPPEFDRLMTSLCGDKAPQLQVWSCNLLAECLAVADEKTLKALMSHGQNHPCPLPPPPHPQIPPPTPTPRTRGRASSL